MTYRHKALLSNPSYHDDLYIVSFPKSGATWMNFLMANIHLRSIGDNRKVNFFNIHDFIPDIHVTRHVKKNILSFPGFRIIKSHSDYNPYYHKVIYIIRNPLDVMVSYYLFLKGLKIYNGTLSMFIRNDKYGIKAWVRHVKGWMNLTSADVSFITISYEGLKRDAVITLESLYNKMGYNIAGEVINYAVCESSFEKMRASELEYGYGGRTVGKSFVFMRKGKSGGWKQDLSHEDVQFIYQAGW